MNTAHSILVRTLACGLFVLFTVISTNAQFKAGIQGTVTDSTGGLVPEAQVTLTNNETSKSQTTTASNDGFYRFSSLPPGAYTLSAEKTGFKKQVFENVVINAEATQGIDIVLTAGEIAETVTVTETTTQALETENANVSRAITTREIQQLPQAGRDPYELLRLTPGIFGTGARAGGGQSLGFPNGPGNDPNVAGPGGSNTSIFQTENQVPISANGQRVSNNNFTVDGVSVNSLGFGGAAVVTPNQESVKEVRVLSSSYSAEDGRNSGAQVKVVSQNGTNEFHGSAFFKYNDPGLNAFNKFGDFNGGPTTRVENRFRQFGGSLGGPLYLPRFGEGGSSTIGGKNKTFFFFSFEALRNKTNNPVVRYVETPQYRQLVQQLRPGSVTARVFATAGIEPRIISVLPSNCGIFGNDPNRCRVVPGGLDIGSPTGARGQYVPFSAPTGGGFDGIPDIQFVQIADPDSTRGLQLNPRFDFHFGANQIALSAYVTHLENNNNDIGAQSRPIADLIFKPVNSAATLTFNRIMNATTFNEARVNFTRFSANQVESSASTNFGIPRIEVEGLPLPSGERIRFGAERAETTPGIFAQNTFEVSDTLSKVFGNHGMKFGGLFRREQDNNSLVGGARPVFSFVGLFNLANDTPIFEAVNVDPRTGGPADAQRYFRSSNYAFFVQDDWKARPNLTLNLGLRYEYFTPLTEKEGRLAVLRFGSQGLQNSRIEIVDQFFKPDRNNFGPRFGFAYSPNFGDSLGGLLKENRAVIRGGAGIQYNRIPNVLFANSRGNPPFFARNTGICCGTAGPAGGDGFGTPFVDGRILYALGASNSPFSFPANPLLGPGIDPVSGGVLNNTVEIYGTDREVPNSYVYTYSLEMQYELPLDLVGTVGYQGSSAHKLIRIVNQNLLFPRNPRFDPVFFIQPDVNSNYNALNANLQRRLSNGLQLNANYRFSKSIDALSYEGPGGGTNQTNPGDLASERGPSDFDVRHSFNLSSLYELPFYRNRRDALGKLLGGFQLTGIVTANSGYPFTPKIFEAIRQPSGEFFGPIRPTGYFGGALDDTSNEAFLRPGGNFPGGGPRYFPITPGPPGIGRNSFRGPRYFSVDMSVVKKTGLPGFLGEEANLELRANFFNVFNQLNLQPIRFFDDGAIIRNSNFGRSTRGLSGRVVELQARFRF